MEKLFEKYQKNQVMTVSGEKLVLMLCDGLVRFIKNAILAFDQGNIQEINTNLLKAQAILSEMMVSLDTESGEFAEKLFLIYDFLYHGLIEANIKKDVDQIKDLLQLAIEVQETWNMVSKALHSEKAHTSLAQ